MLDGHIILWLQFRHLTVNEDGKTTDMRRQKRDMNDRAFQKGYQAGLVGRDQGTCPHTTQAARHYWLSGWREGRSDSLDGFTGVSGMHCEQQQ